MCLTLLPLPLPYPQWFLAGGILPRLLALLRDEDPTCRVKAVLALSALMRHHRPALEAMRSSGGLEQLVGALKEEGVDRRLARRAGGGLGLLVSTLLHTTGLY